MEKRNTLDNFKLVYKVIASYCQQTYQSLFKHNYIYLPGSQLLNQDNLTQQLKDICCILSAPFTLKMKPLKTKSPDLNWRKQTLKTFQTTEH